MKLKFHLMLASTLAVSAPALADEQTPDQSPQAEPKPAASLMTTGVARARDRLDSATSTSMLSEDEIEKLGARSLAEIFRAVPGVRAESTGGEGFANISVRGLPIALGGAKFLQIQENGIPTLEFGDIAFFTQDVFLRADLNLGGLQVIRGGSASTFASNSPGGIVNLIDRTGLEAGGSFQVSSGLDYDLKRIDFVYGAPLGDGLRFNVGGYYRNGEGPRHTGFKGYDGGQIKLNVTKEFAGGYVRVYGKWLDDHSVSTPYAPVAIAGTDADPHYSALPGFDYGKDTLYSRYIPTLTVLDDHNNVANYDFSDATHAKMKSLGIETKLDLGEWRVNGKARYARISGHITTPYTLSNASAQLPFHSVAAAPEIMAMFHASGISYASGPQTGQAIADPTSLNGNGLLALQSVENVKLNSLDNLIGDLRASRVWNIGEGKLTFTAGYYHSRQDLDMAWLWSTLVSDVTGDGNAHLIDMAAGPYPLTQNGYLAYNTLLFGGIRHDRYDLRYTIDAPYGSLNYAFGKVALGASVRYDMGRARGNLFGTSVPGNPPFSVYDVNGDGMISLPETLVGTIDYSNPSPVHYNYHYLSYSVSANYRASENFSLFARYSKGGRANADRILFANYVDPVSGHLLVKEAAYDRVIQAEGGIKYRTEKAELYVTGFWAKTGEHNIGLDRKYRAYGVELEGSVHAGPFSMNAGATWTKAKITADAYVPANVGNSPKHQADLIFQAMPQVEAGPVTFGAAIEGTTSSFAGDTAQLKMPGWVTVNPFVQYKPIENVTLMVNANNLFDVAGLVEVDAEFLPTNGIGTARTINPRTISASIRFDF